MKRLIPVFLALSAVTAVKAQTFTPTSFIKEGFQFYSAYCAAAADFNGDGKIDLMGTTVVSQTMAVFANTSTPGNVTFGPESDFTTNGYYHQAAAAGDLDGDGKPDLVLTNTNPASISVFPNTSAGGGGGGGAGGGGAITFGTRQDYASTNYPYAVAIGDLDGDGKPDIVADYSGGVLSIYRNVSVPGQITMAQRVDIAAGTGPNSLAIVDVDGDGKPDLVFSNSSGLVVMTNASTTGAFSFGSPVTVASVAGVKGVVAGDLDGDGKPDLAVADPGSNNLVILRNTSSPGAVSFAAAQDLPSLLSPESIVIGDLDGDGKADLFTQGINPLNAVSVYRNTSTTGSLSFEPHVDYNVFPGECFFGAIADVDGNGRPDLITSTFTVLGNMYGVVVPVISSFSPAAGVTGTVITVKGSGFTGVHLVTFSGVPAASFTVVSDSVLSVVVGTGASGYIYVTNDNATASMNGFYFYPPAISSYSPTVANSGDTVRIFGSWFTGINSVKFGNAPAASFTVDSLTGITAIVGNGQSGDVSVQSPNGLSTLPGFIYGPPRIDSFVPAVGSVGSVVTLYGKNFNTDPSQDDVYFGSVPATISGFPSSGRLQVRVPAGADYEPMSLTTGYLTGSSVKPFVVTWPSDSPAITARSFQRAGSYLTGGNPSDVVLTDLSGGGSNQVITLDRGTGNISIFWNVSTVGHIRFEPKVDFNAGGNDLRGIAAADMDGDGKRDLVILDSTAGNYYPYGSGVWVLQNYFYNGTIAFDGRFYATMDTAAGMCVADMNGDGKPDVVLSSPVAGKFSILPNTSIPMEGVSFGSRIDFINPDSSGYIIAADVDGDGRPDVILLNGARKVMSIFRNTGGKGVFAFAPGVDYATAAGATYVQAGDMDGDGKLDLVVGGPGGVVSWFPNRSVIGTIAIGIRQDSLMAAANAVFADLNGDGKVDAGFGGVSGSVSLLGNASAGAGSLAFASPVGLAAGAGGVRLYSADLDGDSKPDLIVLDPLQDSIILFRNTIGDPVVQRVSPDTAVKGTMVKITGRNFTGAVSVSFGGVRADSFTVVSSGEIDAYVGSGASGNVVVTTLYGIDSIGGFYFIPQIVAEGPTRFCSGGSVWLKTTSSFGNQWLKDGVPIAGATADSLQVDSSGVYTVQTTSEGITTGSAGITVTVIVVPMPVITRDASGDLVSSSATGNQWYLYGSPLTGDSAQVLKPLEAGSYQVTVAQDGCVSALSDPYMVILSGVVYLDSGQYVRYFPNPVVNVLYVSEYLRSQVLPLNITLLDARGNVLTAVQSNGFSSIDVSRYGLGVYYLHIFGSSGSYSINKTFLIVKVNWFN